MATISNITAALVSLGIPRADHAHHGISWSIEDWSEISFARDDGYTQSVAISDTSQPYGSRIDFCCDASGRLVRIELDRCCPVEEAAGYEIPTVLMPITSTPAEAVAHIAALNAKARHYIATHHA